MAQLGDKTQARTLAESAGQPLLAGINRPCSLTEVEAFYAAHGPVMIKALAGGGGRGIRAVSEQGELHAAYQSCQSEAKLSFGSGEVYVEQLLPRARHIEVQILGDGLQVAQLGERECSLQRRKQKLLEIAPSPSLGADQRRAIIDSALALAQAINYKGLGTFEYLLDAQDPSKFYFMEINPRIQVEHTITEEISGQDLVALQIQLAAGRPLAELGLDKHSGDANRGFAIQARVNLESLAADGSAKAAAGVLSHYQPPRGLGIRVDDYGYSGYCTSPSYDSLLAKVIASGRDYPSALKKLGRALAEFELQGPSSNLGLLCKLVGHKQVIINEVDTEFVERSLSELLQTEHRARFSSNADTAAAQIVEDDIPPGSFAQRSPTAGVLTALCVEVGDEVQQGQDLAVVEAMKMEFPIKASHHGWVTELKFELGAVVNEQALIMLVEENEAASHLGSSEAELDLDSIRADLQEFIERRNKTLDEHRQTAVAKRHSKGMRTARENIDDLIDPGSFNEYGAFALAAQRKIRSVEELIEVSPADGMVAGTAQINGAQFGEEAARAMVLSYDYTVFAGTQGMMNHKKTDRVLGIAKDWQLPVVLFAEGGGGRPSDTDFAGVAGLDCHTFSAMAELSGLVPTVGIVAGRCFAGNAALLGVCDVTIATANATVGMGGPAMIEGGGLGKYSPEEVGPVELQGPNGVIDILVEDEAAAVAAAKQYLGYFQGPLDRWEQHDPRLLRHAIPENRMQIYDVKQLIEQLADVGSVLELRPEFARGMITALVRIEGKAMGLVANNPRYLGGAIDAEGADKMSRFMQLCDAHGLPILSLCDTPGFMVGPESEAKATVRHVSRIFVTAASIGVPYITLVTRKGYGLGAQGMAAGSFHNPMLTAAWPSGEFGAMGIEGAVRLAAAKQLAAIEDPEQRQAVFQKMVDKIYESGKALNMASYLEIDAVIDPLESRQWIGRALQAAPRRKDRGAVKNRPCVDTW
ncbi:MAG: carbamoyl-phosphate synthase large subunit [Cellvibrionaceae bacterium]|nr:carbamoyl-phosphate synthase large subunit [Cellvibrionaceae bacterium]